MGADKKSKATSKSSSLAKGGTQDTDKQVQRISDIIEEMAKKCPEQVQPHLKKAAPYLAKAWIYFLIILPSIMKGIKEIQKLISQLPEPIITAMLGFLVCFFGGVFPATIAAAEAWNSYGGAEAWSQAGILFGEFMKVADASKKDDAKDEDKDGKPDNKDLPADELVEQKLLLALKIMDPEKVNAAVVCLYTGWVAVVGVLKMQFAKTVALGTAIGDKVYGPASRLEPMLCNMVPEDYHKWVPFCTKWSCKIIAVSMAWWVTRVISAVHSAVRGGLIFGKHLVDYLHKNDILKQEHKDTYIDEGIGWTLAVLGFTAQFMCGFQLPFLLSFLLWPVQLLEAFIVWSVSW
eukprot:TRINITY_DN15652_c0_g1_i1.p1 TRINITY_DN15652_c0_g1~~TRINITY_DN15652_c0_g1_i1.p1  ORF type:complete len:348 (+),score=81.89 TRINITY_DN15652_c0_g1_i1:80-1123(+)